MLSRSLSPAGRSVADHKDNPVRARRIELSSPLPAEGWTAWSAWRIGLFSPLPVVELGLHGESSCPIHFLSESFVCLANRAVLSTSCQKVSSA